MSLPSMIFIRRHCRSVTDFKVFYYRASIPYDSRKTMEENMGKVEAFTGLPVWKFRLKLIPGLICMSPKWSIISEILTEAIKYFYQLNVFEQRQDGPTPFGLLDIRGSRLQLSFLEYINSTTPDRLIKCIQTLRTPNATYVWKIGDSCHQNGCWKMEMTV